MNKVVIQTEGLGKRYRRGVHVDTGLRHALERFVRSPLRSLRGARPEVFWALRDVSLEVREGEVLGLIGRNGAGKTTLLKILSRITRPTEGWAEIRGRVRSLLEVGTGFHGELTGRENTYLSGSILGMSKREINRKFDEIVAFAEIDKFVDTPVKHYSSGMYVRLAFAVAAHLEPEILLVDEVLAVGDAAFQKKCLGKMGDVSRQGRTIVFVSHNMTAVKTLCSKAVLMRDGAVTASGMVADVVDDYLLGTAPGASAKEWRDLATAPGNENVRISYVRIIPPEDKTTITIDTGVLIEIGFDNLREDINLDCTVYLISSDGVLIFESGHIISSDGDSRHGSYHLKGRIPAHLLNGGRYSLTVVFGKDQRYVLFRMDEVVSFEVENTATGRGLNMGVAPGIIRPMLSWRHSFEEKCSLVKES
ncbi:MAG TPA: ABC transporter ATP-binding protein [Candidatus Dormibacteraeota bacterium]|nr:ABC transporter ATP-binding protein [Candidatus Dormibacteraeota bacterium]